MQHFGANSNVATVDCFSHDRDSECDNYPMFHCLSSSSINIHCWHDIGIGEQS